MAGTRRTVYTCGGCGATYDTSVEAARCNHPASPCKHEWRQYMGIKFVNIAGEMERAPDGFYCIHCTQRRD